VAKTIPTREAGTRKEALRSSQSVSFVLIHGESGIGSRSHLPHFVDMRTLNGQFRMEFFNGTPVAIAQTQDGIWIGTQALVRFDGVRFVP